MKLQSACGSASDTTSAYLVSRTDFEARAARGNAIADLKPLLLQLRQQQRLLALEHDLAVTACATWQAAVRSCSQPD